MMKKLSIVLVAFICTPIFASAVPENLTIGSYNISFDLGLPHDAYIITTGGPGYTVYGDICCYIGYFLRINSTNYTIAVSWTDLSIGANFSSEEMKKDLEIIEEMKKDIERIPSGSRAKISDHPTFDVHEIAAKEKLVFSVSYDLYSINTRILIQSTFPWNEGTLQFLKTIRIEKTNETENINATSFNGSYLALPNLLTPTPRKILKRH